MQRETRIAHYVVGILTALSLVLLSLPLSAPVRSLKACLAYVFDPLAFEGEHGYEKISSAPARMGELLLADMDNKRLTEELRQTAWLKTTVEALTIENERLHQALSLKATPARHPIWAHVMERDPLRWYSSISVDAGEDSSISLDDPVLARKNDVLVVVGRVVEVRPRTATVLLLTDQRSAVAAYLSSGTLEGLVQGQDGPRLRMNYLNSEAHIASDDSVYTSPTSVIFPPDILIGRLDKVYPPDPFLAFQSVEVLPALDAAAMQEVMILTTKEVPVKVAAKNPHRMRGSPADAAAAAAPALTAPAAAPKADSDSDSNEDSSQ